MNPSSVVDTFSDFINFWQKVKTQEIDVQIEKWKSSYMEKYPDLCEKQITDYRNSGVEWRDVAKRYVFSRLPNYVQVMPKIHSRLLKCLDPKKSIYFLS